MFGTYRFVLALAVLLSHLHIRVLERNIGVVAVISFFLLSGFVMTGLVGRHYGEAARVGWFYLDRCARLFPQYLLFVGLTVAFFLATGFVPAPSPGLVWRDVVVFALMLPAGYLTLWPFHVQTLIMPQAWSLGLELTFYLVFPFLLYWRLRGAAAVASLLVFAAAVIGYLPAELYAYQWLAGTLFIFLAGSWLFSDRRLHGAHPALLIWLAGLPTLAWVFLSGRAGVPWNVEVLAGILLGIPIVFGLAKLKSPAWDELLGNLSYGTFLCHMIPIWATKQAGMADGLPRTLVVIGSSVLLAWVGFQFVETPFLRWRRKLRRREEPPPPAAKG